MNYKTEMTGNNAMIQELLSTLQNLPNIADVRFDALKEIFRCTEVAVDTFTFASTTDAYLVPVSHSLGEAPTFFVIYSLSNVPVEASNMLIQWALVDTNEYYDGKKAGSGGMYILYVQPSMSNLGTYANAANTELVTPETVKLQTSNYKYAAGIEYTLITMA